MIIAVDFDGTICEHLCPGIGKDVPGAIKWLLKFQEAEARLILYTLRDKKLGVHLALDHCLQKGLHFWAVNQNPEQKSWSASKKVYADIYIDNAAAGCPLVSGVGGQRPMVDWSVVGPMVMQRIEELEEQAKL